MDSPKTLLILGGYGNTGRPLVDLLLRETDARMIIAGRSAGEKLRGWLTGSTAPFHMCVLRAAWRWMPHSQRALRMPLQA